MTAAKTDPSTVKKIGDDIWCEWPDLAVRVRFSSLREKDHALMAELTVYIDKPGVPVPAEWTTLDLAQSFVRDKIADRLRQQFYAPWADMLKAAAYAVREMTRGGEPVTTIGGDRPLKEVRYTLYPLLPENQISMIYGDGASLKSMICMAVGMSVQECRDLLPGTNTRQSRDVSRQGPTLYCDYETNEDEQHARISRLAAGFDLGSATEMAYRQCYVPLHRDAPALRELVDRLDARLVIVDSMGAALGGDPNDAQAVITALGVLRSLKTTVLVVDHVNKMDDQGKPVGNGYKYNYVRSAFHAKRVQENDSDEVRVALIHRKANNGKLVSPLGFTVIFPEYEGGPIRIEHLDVRGDPDLAEHTTVAARIEYVIRNRPQRRPAIVQALDTVKPQTFNKTWDRMLKAGRLVALDDGTYGLPAYGRGESRW